MPEIPGNNPIPGGHIPGRGGATPRTPGAGMGAGSVGGVAGASNLGPEAKVVQQVVKFFGFHTEASIMARLAQMGMSPTLANLRIAQQLLRYGQGLDAASVNNIAQLWGQYGSGDVVALEALVVLHAQGLAINGQNLQAMMQLIGGGPLSHLLARLTMALKSERDARLSGLGKRLTAFWQLGHLDKDMIGQLGKFERELSGLAAELAALELKGLSDETIGELSRLKDLFNAHQMLAKQSNPTQYIPFFIWRDQQPLPAELLVQDEGGGGPGASNFQRVTLAVETKNLGRITVDLTHIREHLSGKFEVSDEKIKKLIDARLVLLRQKLMASPYMVDILACQATGNERAVSALLPKRRDIKKLGRAHGIL